jgi:hypothetical protein
MNNPSYHAYSLKKVMRLFLIETPITLAVQLIQRNHEIQNTFECNYHSISGKNQAH